jgi:phosphate transport system substrate-binding protein
MHCVWVRILVVLAVISAVSTASAETLRVGGTGMALASMRSLGTALTARNPDLAVEVLPSLGSGGGLQALTEGAIDVAATARDLKPVETAAGLRLAACAKTPFVLATSLTKPQGVTRAEIPALFSNPAATWSDGTPLRILLRTKDDADTVYMIDNIPGMAAALEIARRRPDVPVAATDQENAELAQKTAGSLATMTLMQAASEHLNLRLMKIDGVAPSADTLQNGSYKFLRTVCLALSSRRNPAADQFIAFVRSESGAKILRQSGALPDPTNTF